MKKIFTILFAFLLCSCTTEQQSQIKSDSLCIVGASFAYPENCWFELACEQLGLKPINKAISGSNIKDTAQSMRDNTLFTLEELDSFATFVIMHTHNYNICLTSGVHALRHTTTLSSSTLHSVRHLNLTPTPNGLALLVASL